MYGALFVLISSATNLAEVSLGNNKALSARTTPPKVHEHNHLPLPDTKHHTSRNTPSGNNHEQLHRMAPLEINVTGTATTYRPAERSVLVLLAKSKPFPTAQEADSSIASIINSLCDAIEPYCPHDIATASKNENTGIAHYSFTTFETSSGHSRSHDTSSSLAFSKSSKFETTFTASMEMSIEFIDFKLLARIAIQTRSMECVAIKSHTWTLTPSTQIDAQSQARKNAAKNAILKARNYAEACAALDEDEAFAAIDEDEASSKVRAILIKEVEPYKMLKKAKLHFRKVNNKTTQKSEWDWEPLDIGVEVKVDGKFVVDF